MQIPASLDWLKVDPEDACFGDLLCQIFVKLGIKRVVLLSVLIYGVGLMGYGAVVTYLNQPASPQFIGITNPQELGFAFATYWIYTPIVWCCYVWQPHLIADVLRQLHANQLIGSPKPTLFPIEMFKPAMLLRKTLVTSLIVIAVAFATWIYAWVYLPSCPHGSPCGDQPGGWIEKNPFFLYWIWTPLLALNIIMLLIIITRQMLVARAFSRLFRSYVLRPKLYHPDGCNGLAFVGNFALASMSIVTFAGLWLTFFTVYPSFFGHPISIDAVNWFYYISLSLALPFFFISPVWSTHRAMYDARDQHLKPLAQALDTTIGVRVTKPLDPKDLAAWSQAPLESVQVYEALAKAHETLPFQRSRALSFLITAILPPLLAAISLVIQIIQSK
jgi:hypothetical protein